MSTEEIASGSSRLGKEAKIGASVILALLLVLGAAVVVRLVSSNSDDTIASAAEQGADASKPTGAHQVDAVKKSPKPASPKASNRPTIVSPGAASVKPPKTPAGDLDRWELTTVKPEPKRRAPESSSPSAAPSFMPLPPQPSPENRYADHASDPSPRRNVAASSPLREVTGDLPLITPGKEKPYRVASARSVPDFDDADGHASTTDAASSSSSPRKNSRYDSSAASPPPASSHAGSSHAVAPNRAMPTVPTMPVSQYRAPATSDYRGSTRRNHDGNILRRSDSAQSHGSTPKRRKDGQYKVQPNDSYWVISQTLYGTGAYFNALAKHNRSQGNNQERLQPGDLISAPSVMQLEQAYPELCPKPSRRETLQNQASTVGTRRRHHSGRSYTVAEGDTLFNIARYELGKASRWVEIYEMNRDALGNDFNYLTPGTQLAMPQDEQADVIARPPENGYRRR